jgi:D-alanine-D-alanine ligase-like ATP-grasp enzyme
VSDGGCLLQALTERNVAHRYLSAKEIGERRKPRQPTIEFRLDDALYYFDGSLRGSAPHSAANPRPLVNDSGAVALVKEKHVAKAFLNDHGINVPKGAVFARDARSEAERYFESFAASLPSGACVKPSNSSSARQVTVGIGDLSSFRAAFAAVAEHHQWVLIEETVPGTVHRFFCLGGQVIAVHAARIPSVEGDGVHATAELIRLKNAERKLHPNPAYSRYPLQLPSGQNGLHVPRAGEIVFLGKVSDLRHGGEKNDATDAVHPSYVDMVERVASYFPGLLLCGPDVIIADASAPASKDNYYVLELNGRGPGFVDHHYPWSGQPRDVAGPLIDHLCAAGQRH